MKTHKIIIVYTLILIGFIISLSEVIYRLERSHDKNIILKYLFDTGSSITQQIQENLDNGIFATDILDIFLSTSDFDLNQFNRWGENILRINSNASTVQLAPDGVVQYIYPLNGNEGAIGHDLLKDQRRNDGALKTIKNKTLTIVGPIKLIQNNRMAIIARKPIFSKVSGKEQFWGFTIVLIYIEDLLPESLLKLENQGILYQIVGDDPDSGFPPILKSSETISDHWDYILPIEMANGSWQLKLSSNKLIPDNFAQFRLFGMTLALVFGLLFYRQQKNGLTRSLKIEYLNTDLTLTTHELLDEKEKLQKAIEEIKTLQGIIPICSHCHKIRNDDQIWDRLETYLSENTDAKLSHGICPECLKEHYPDFQNDD